MMKSALKVPTSVCLAFSSLLLGCPADDTSAADDSGSTSGETTDETTTSAASTGTPGTATTATSGSTGEGDTAGSSAGDSTGMLPSGIETCDDMAAYFVNTPATTETVDCGLVDGSTSTCCRFTFGSDLVEDGPYCPESRTSPPPYGLSVYDGATNPGLRPFNGEYLDDIEADGYEPMVDENGNTNIVTGLGSGGGDGSNCLAIDQEFDLTIEVNVPLSPVMAAQPSEIGEVENLGVSLMGVPGTGHPPSAVLGPSMGPPGGVSDAINVPSIGSCGAHPDPAGYLHDHFVPQVMNAVLESNGIAASDVECTTYAQDSTAMYGFAKDGFPIFASRDAKDALPEDLDGCGGHSHATPGFPDGVYHYHASESAVPNFMECLSGVAVQQSFRYY